MQRSKLEIVYSVGVIVAIPLLLAVNTILLVRSTRSAFNQELRRKSDLVNSTIAETSAKDIQDKNFSELSDMLTEIEQSQPAIRQTQVFTKDDGQVALVANGVDGNIEMTASRQSQINLAYERKQPIAQFINISDNGRASQAWNVATPVIVNDEVIAVVNSSILTTDADETIDAAYTTSFIVMVVSILVIVVLLFRHFRLVGYVQLLAKQKELNQTMSDFLSVATHELKAPTSIIKGYLSNVMDGTFGPIDDKVHEQLETALGQTDRLNTLVYDLLNVSRIDQGHVEYNITEVDSSKILTTIVQNYKMPAEQKGLTLNLQTLPSPIPVKVDEGRLQEIFTNLIDNAIKYTKQGSVSITQTEKDGYIVTSIRDTGFGMSPEARKRLFQRFYRIKTDQTQNIGGTGLGLWIIKQYTEAMGGSIEVESLEGTGSNFIVSFPKS